MSTRKTIALAASLVLASSVAVVTAPVAEAKAKSAAPGKVSAIRVSNVTANGAVLSWRNPKSKKSAKFTGTVVRVAAGTRAPKSVKNGVAVASLNAKKHTVGVRRLAPGTVYTVSIFSAGRKKHYSKAATVRVQTAPAAVTGLYAQTTTSSLTLGWRSSSRSAAGAIVRYAVGSIPATPASGKAIAVRGRTPGATVGGLRFGTTYGVAVWAFDAAHHISPRTAAAFKTAPPTAGGVSGVVTESGTNKPLRNAQIDLYEPDGDVNEHVKTAANGTYSFAGVKPGTYALRVYGYDAEGGLSEAGYVETDIDNLVIKAGDPRRIAVALEQGAGIKGSIVGSDDPSVGLGEAEVYTKTSDDYDSSVGDETDEDGTFTLTEIPASVTSGVCFDSQYVENDGPDDDTGYQEDCRLLAAGDLVPGKFTDLGTVALSRGGAIAGKLHFAGSKSSVDIAVFDNEGKQVGYGYNDEDESTTAYKAGGLKPGADLYVCAYAEDDDAYESRCYDGTTDGVPWNGDDVDVTKLKPVQVQVGQTTKDIDFTLPEVK